MPQIAIFCIEDGQLFFHFHFHRNGRNIGRLQLTSPAMDEHCVTSERDVSLPLIFFLDAALQKFLPLSLTMDNENLRRLRALEIVDPIHQLIGVSMGGKTITDPAELGGWWQCYMLWDPNNEMDSYGEELMNVEITANGSSIDWKDDYYQVRWGDSEEWTSKEDDED